MFCPNCGLDEKQPNQFCRACGANLRPVLEAVGRSDNITTAAISAREEIGRAMAAKIREATSADELSTIAEDVLPEIEKFLESPAEKRLRRIRTGTILSFIGMGVAVSLSVVSVMGNKDEFLFLAGLGGVLFFIGLAFIVNGILLTVPKQTVADHAGDADSQRILDASTSGLSLPEPPASFRSVTENTTAHLGEKKPVRRH